MPNQITNNETDDSANNIADSAVNESAPNSQDISRLENGFANDDKATPSSDESKGFYNPSADKSRFSNVTKLASSNRKKYAIAGIGIIAIIALILFIMSLLKIPNYAENIALYRLARTAQQYSKTSARIDAEKVSLETASDEKYKILKEKTGTLRERTFGKLDGLRPEKVYSNLATDGRLSYATEKVPTKFGYSRTKITGVIIDGNTIPINESSRFNPIKNYQDKIRFSTQLEAHVDEAIRGRYSLVRGDTAKAIRAKLGIRLSWWERAGAKYKGLKSEEALRLQYKESVERLSATNSSPKTPVTSELKSSQEEVNRAVTACDNNPACVDETIKENKPVQEVNTAIENVGKQSFAQKALGAANIAYAVGIPLCLIYDGSIVNLGPTIDAQQESASKAFYAVQSASDQQKTGDTVMEAVGAFNHKIGDGDSTVDQYMSGQTPDTTVEHSPQADVIGNYTLINSIFGDGVLAKSADGLAGRVCPVVTDPTVMTISTVGIVIAKIASAIASGGGSAVAGTAAEEGAKIAIEGAVKRSFTKSLAAGFAKGLVFREGKLATTSTFKAKSGDFLGKFAGNFVAIEAATAIAKMYVINSAGLVNDAGRTSDSGFKNLADMGGTVQNDELSRQQFYAAPLTNEDLAKSDARTTAYLDKQFQNKSTYEKFFATSDPRSLISKFSYSLYSFKRSPLSATIQNFSLKNIVNIFSLRTLDKKTAAEENADPLNKYFHMVQWDWTDKEQALIDSDPSYGMLDNAEVLDNAGDAKIADIEAKYGKCFTESIGTLLSEGYIVRDEDGGVIVDKGDCSPKNLSFNNPDYGDLVFRWRVYNKYNNTADMNEGIQNPTANDSPTDISIATYNIRNGNTSDSDPVKNEKPWDTRSSAVLTAIKSNYADIWGFQEVWSDDQVEDLQAGLDNIYEHSNTLKESKESVIFYAKQKYRKIDSESEGGFKLEKLTLNKYCGWIGLERISDSVKFYVVDCHLTPGSGGAVDSNRLAQTKQIIAEIKKFNKNSYPTIIMGDFNLHNDDDKDIVAYLRDNNFTDAYTSASQQNRINGNCSSYNDFDSTFCHKDITKRGTHLDRIFLNPGNETINVSKHMVITSKYNGIWPSDHNPVQAFLSLNTPNPQSGAAPGSVAVGNWTWPIKQTISFSTCFNESASKGPHPGLDFRAKYVPAYAVADGVVDGKPGGSYGILKIKHTTANGMVWSIYEHMSTFTVSDGQAIRAGDKVGETGNTAPPGGSSGPHLHFGMTTDPEVFEYADMSKNTGKIINPLVYLNGSKDYAGCSAEPKSR